MAIQQLKVISARVAGKSLGVGSLWSYPGQVELENLTYRTSVGMSARRFRGPIYKPHKQESPPFGGLCETVDPSSQENWPQSNNSISICGRTEVAGDVISGRNARTFGSYLVLNFDVGMSCSFR